MIFSRYGFVVLIIALLNSGCSISDRVKNKASVSSFVLIVFADDTCELTLNGTELFNLKREVGAWGNVLNGYIYHDICSLEGSRENSIWISSNYPNVRNPPLAYSNLKSSVENNYNRKHMYFPETMVFPITYQRKGFFSRTNSYFAIDEFAEVQLSIHDPDWESLNYKSSFARGFAYNGYQLSAMQGEATFYGVAEIATHNILYKLTGSVRRTSG